MSILFAPAEHRCSPTWAESPPRGLWGSSLRVGLLVGNKFVIVSYPYSTHNPFPAGPWGCRTPAGLAMARTAKPFSRTTPANVYPVAPPGRAAPSSMKALAHVAIATTVVFATYPHWPKGQLRCSAMPTHVDPDTWTALRHLAGALVYAWQDLQFNATGYFGSRSTPCSTLSTTYTPKLISSMEQSGDQLL